jgi:Protein of unknown function (DUF2806)
MSTDIVPRPTPDLSSFIKELNLPSIIAGPAGTAIARLIGATVDIPVAYLEGFARDIRFKIDAKDTVNKEIATAAARLAAGDSDLVARAAHSLVRKEFRRQDNKEAIAVKTIELLRDDTKQFSEQVSETPKLEPESEVDADWLNVFERYAEDASTERLQLQWASILAGEIRKPRSFSLKTLRFVSELDSYTAQLFEKYADFVFNNDFIPSHLVQSGQPLMELYHLQEFGLVSGVGGTLSTQFVFETDAPAAMFYRERLLLVRAQVNSNISIQAVMLTKTGKEILGILPRKFDLERLKIALDQLPKERFTSIQLTNSFVSGPDGRFNFTGPMMLLWQQPSS